MGKGTERVTGIWRNQRNKVSQKHKGFFFDSYGGSFQRRRLLVNPRGKHLAGGKGILQ
jgi:hypothetical protein